MKKIVLAIALVGISSVAFSQAKVEIGLKGGVNMATLNADNFNNGDVTAFHGGAYGLIKITKFGIQPEVLFSKRGDGQTDLAYMDVPVMAKFYLAGGLNIQAGPQFGVLLSAERTDGTDVKDLLKASDLSAAMGLGWDLPFGLNVTGRYILGLKDVNDDPNGASVKGNTYQLSVGYKLFKIGN
jgi:hypothetical protein